MCELEVIVDGGVVFKDAIYAGTRNAKVVVRDALGRTEEFSQCSIIEVDINSKRLVLARAPKD